MSLALTFENTLDGLPAPAPARKPTLLVVDDEEGPRQSLWVVFKDDFNVLLASDGPAAIDLARHQRIDVAVLDIRMTEMSGLDVLERLKFVDPDIEAVMMTAFETAETIRQALQLRACDYINKPFDLGTMRGAVAKALGRRSLASELRHNLEKLDALQGELQQERLDGRIERGRGEIYASIIHDINGPLTIISGMIQMINDVIAEKPSLEGEDLEITRDRLKRITRQATNCIEISRRYLSFLRKTGKNAAKVWVNHILGDLGELLRVHPCTKNNQLLIHPLAEEVTAQINGTDLIQILLNLTLNGLQCSSSYHTVEIHGQILRHPLDLSQFEDGPEDRFLNRDGFKNTPPLLALSVQDNGPGIPPGIMPKIFEPFYTAGKRPTGVGLGLCIVHRLLTAADGGLQVRTKAGHGTVFTLYLPARVGSPDTGFKLALGE